MFQSILLLIQERLAKGTEIIYGLIFFYQGASMMTTHNIAILTSGRTITPLQGPKKRFFL